MAVRVCIFFDEEIGSAMGKVIDITDPTEPLSLAREMVERAPGCKAALAVLVRDDGTIWYDCSGQSRMEIVWALSKMKLQVLTDNAEL